MPLSSLGLSSEHLPGQDVLAPSSLCPPPPNELICLGLPTPLCLKGCLERTWQKTEKEEGRDGGGACAQSPQRKWRWVRRAQEEFIAAPGRIRGGLGSSGRGGQYWFLAGLLSHVPAGWFGACCPVNPLSTCQTSVDAETVAEASER